MLMGNSVCNTYISPASEDTSGGDTQRSVDLHESHRFSNTGSRHIRIRTNLSIISTSKGLKVEQCSPPRRGCELKYRVVSIKPQTPLTRSGSAKLRPSVEAVVGPSLWPLVYPASASCPRIASQQLVTSPTTAHDETADPLRRADCLPHHQCHRYGFDLQHCRPREGVLLRRDQEGQREGGLLLCCRSRNSGGQMTRCNGH